MLYAAAGATTIIKLCVVLIALWVAFLNTHIVSHAQHTHIFPHLVCNEMYVSNVLICVRTCIKFHGSE